MACGALQGIWSSKLLRAPDPVPRLCSSREFLLWKELTHVLGPWGAMHWQSSPYSPLLRFANKFRFSGEDMT